MKSNISVILSGGSGLRFGSDLPKQYHELGGREVISYVTDALMTSKLTDETVIVCDKPHIQRLTDKYGAICIEGGSTHNASVKNGLDYIKLNRPQCKNIIVFDSVRPFITGETADKLFGYLNGGYDAVITAAHITDSLGQNGFIFTNRDDYYLIQKPEAFRFDLLYRYFKAESEATAIVQQLPQSANIKKYFGLIQNLKITYPQDLIIAKYLLSEGCK